MKKHILLMILLVVPLALADLQFECTDNSDNSGPFSAGTTPIECELRTTNAINGVLTMDFVVVTDNTLLTGTQPYYIQGIVEDFTPTGTANTFVGAFNPTNGKVGYVIAQPVNFASDSKLFTITLTADGSTPITIGVKQNSLGSDLPIIGGVGGTDLTPNLLPTSINIGADPNTCDTLPSNSQLCNADLIPASDDQAINLLAICPTSTAACDAECSTGYHLDNGACVLDQTCPGGATGTHPDCICGTGQSYDLASNACITIAVSFPTLTADALLPVTQTCDSDAPIQPTVTITGDPTNVLIVMEDLDFFPNEDASPGIHWLNYGGVSQVLESSGGVDTTFFPACPPAEETDCAEFSNAFGECLNHEYKFTAYDVGVLSSIDWTTIQTRADLTTAIPGLDQLTLLGEVTTTYARPVATSPPAQAQDCTGFIPANAVVCGTEAPASSTPYTLNEACPQSPTTCDYHCGTLDYVMDAGEPVCRDVNGLLTVMAAILGGGQYTEGTGPEAVTTDYAQKSVLEKISAIAKRMKALFNE